MAQRLESSLAAQRLRSLLSSTVSGKGLFVQALTYQFAFPAIANTPPGAAVPDPTPQEPQTDLDLVSTAALLGEATVSPEASTYTFEQSQPPPAPDALPVTLVPAAAAVIEIPPAPPLSAPEPIEPIEAIETVDSPTAEAASEFSWLSLAGLTDKETDAPQKLAMTTQENHAPSTADDTLPILIAGPQDLNPGLNTPPAIEPSQSADDLSNLRDPALNTTPTPSVSPNLPSGLPSGLPPSLSPGQEPLRAEPAPAEDLNPQPAETELLPTPPVAELDTEERSPWIDWTDLEVGLGTSFNNFGESSWSILPAVSGQLANGDVITVASGLRQFDQTGTESVSHVPLSLSWQRQLDTIELNASAGVDFFNRLPTDTHASAAVTVPLGSDARLSMSVDQGPYLSNAQTLENQISRWQYGPDFYWQISPELSLFSKLRLSNYSDGNWEQQSFSRLERSIGETATVALNVSNQSFQENVESTSGYFSPSDFLLATAEMSWQEQLTDDLSCGLLGSIGQQRLAGEWALAYRTQAACSVDITAGVQISLGYQLNNVSSDQSALRSERAYGSQEIFGGVRISF